MIIILEMNLYYSSTGYAELPEIAPDTITSWVATAFAVHEHAGLGLSEAPAQVGILSLSEHTIFYY